MRAVWRGRGLAQDRNKALPVKILPGKFNINCPRALTIDLVTGARRKVTVIVWPANPAFLEVTDTEGNVMHFHAETGLDIYRGNTALVNWSESWDK